MKTIVADAIEPALQMLPAAMDSLEARAQLLAIGLQESRFKHRRQVLSGGGRGPAAGFWQFEQGGGCAGVLRHSASRYWMHHVCGIRGCAPVPSVLWREIEHDDVLAAAAARLLLFTDRKRLPQLGDEAGAWDLYERVWRPGKPHRHTWPALYADAVAEVRLSSARAAMDSA